VFSFAEEFREKGKIGKKLRRIKKSWQHFLIFFLDVRGFLESYSM
jgi:hypothetical protein